MRFSTEVYSSHDVTTISGTMIILLLLLAFLQHNGMAAIKGYEEVEKSLLLKLGLSRRPVIDNNVKIPSATMELYKLMKKEKFTLTTSFPLPGLHTMSANTVRTYINKGSAPMNLKSQRYRLQFDVSNLPEPERVKAAEVRITMTLSTKLKNEEFIQILLHDIVKPGAKGLSKPILRLMDSKSLKLSNANPKVISFDVTPAIERLSESNFQENHGMIVQCITTSGSTTRLLDVFDFESFEKPLLMIYTDDGTNKKNALTDSARRSKRSTADGGGGDEPPPAGHKKSRKKKICQMYPMYVDFKEVGFSDWIQAPQGYDAFYCHGECAFPLANHMNATNHAVMQTLMNSVSPAAVPRACCVPTRLTAQTLLYVDDDGKMVLKNYPEMAVAECGCR